jgi:hypothetical protein
VHSLLIAFRIFLLVTSYISYSLKIDPVKAPPSPDTWYVLSPFFHSVVASNENSDHQTIFIPSKQPESNQSPLPTDLALLLDVFFIQSAMLNSFSQPAIDYTGKHLDVVNFGSEVDYLGHQWFQEPPPQSEVKVILSRMDLADSLPASAGRSTLHTRRRRY